jgi:hypothetical protein
VLSIWRDWPEHGYCDTADNCGRVIWVELDFFRPVERGAVGHEKSAAGRPDRMLGKKSLGPPDVVVAADQLPAIVLQEDDVVTLQEESRAASAHRLPCILPLRRVARHGRDGCLPMKRGTACCSPDPVGAASDDWNDPAGAIASYA